MANSKLDSTTIFKAIDVLVNKRIDDLDLDKTIVATIDSYLGKEGAHRVKYNGGFFTAYAQTDTIYQPKTSVYVQVPQNNFSNRKIILGLASSYYIGNNVQAVSSAINNYSVIGTNVLQWANKNIKEQYEKYGFGLNSYSSSTYTVDGQEHTAAYQDSWILYDRANETKYPFYKLDITKLNTYIKEAKAVMLSADFRTILPQEQQRRSEAEYGLIFNLAFKNKDIVYTTNRELFEAVENNVKAWSTSNEYFLSMKELREQWVEKHLDEINDFTTLQLELVKDATEITNFLNSNKNNFTQQEYNIFDSYKFLVTDLSISDFNENINALKEYYYNWFDQSLQLLEDSNNEPTKIISYVLDSSRMIGNPFLFNEFTNQYAIFPIENDFQYIDKIVFYCKGFIEDAVGWQFTDKNRMKMYDPILEEYHGKDIWVKNLQFLALKEISSEYGDYKISIETPKGAIFYSTDESETLTLVSKVRYKEWTNFTDNCTFYWFEKDSRVSSTQDPRYHYYGGIGWNNINGALTADKKAEIEIKASDNKAYENVYLCAAVYDDGSGSPIILKEKIIIYNEACKREITIESDIGTKFKFDVGTPTLTCLIDGKDCHFEDVYDSNDPNYIAQGDDRFSFYWSKRTSAGNVFTFTRTYEDIVQEINNTLDYNTRLSLQRTANQLEGVSYPLGVNGNKIVYPVRNISDNSEIYFDCQVFFNDGISTYCIGNAEILLHNEGIPTLNEYTVVIENGDQVFQYSESGVSPLFADVVTPTNFRHTEPIEIKELKAHLYDPNGVEINSGTYTVQWQYPITNTLILPPEGLYENIVTKDFDMINGLTTNFSIAESFDYQCTNNQIKCIVNYGSTSYSRYTDFFFGKIGDNGTNGTDIVAQIVVINDNTQVLHKEPLTVFEYIDDGEITHKWNIDNNPTETIDPILQINLYNRSTLIDSSELSNIKWQVLGGTSIKTSHWTFTEIANKPYQIELGYESTLINGGYENLIIKGSAKLKDFKQVYYCYYPICIVKTAQSWNALQAELYNANGNNNLYIDKSLYLKQILYNSDGRNPLYNKNQGIFIHGLQKRCSSWEIAGGLGQTWNTANNSIPFKITKDKEDIIGSNKIENTTDINGVYIIPNNMYNGVSCDNRVKITTYSSQRVINKIIEIENNIKNKTDEYNNNIKQIDENIKDIKIEYTRKIRELDKEYISEKNQILNNTDSSEQKKIALESKDDWYETQKNVYNNWQTEQIQIQENNRTNLTNTYNQYVTVQRETLNTLNADKITFIVPIYMALNTFGLASLNAWDGNHIDINEEGGYIVAPQIGAGRKEEDNSFTGIVMGEMSQYGKTESDVGLLGLNWGTQSIFLDSQTGNAYFGLPEEDKFGSSGTTNYNEGRIELKPGDVSKIGGWRIGRRSLYYTASGDIGPGYHDEPINYAVNHEKDINHDDVGILLAANNLTKASNESIETLKDNPYISIKGRKLTSDDVSNEAGTNIKANDYLELQLDPMQRSLLSIFVHRKVNDVWSRTLLSGIDNKGRFIANRLQNGATGSGTVGSSTSFAVSDVFAFKDTDTSNYVGAQFEAGNAVDNTKTFIALFANKSTVNQNNGPIYITGGKHDNNDYSRPLSIHGKTVSLYASNSSSNEISTDSKITISSTDAYIGNSDHYLDIPTSGILTINHTGSSNNGYINIGGSHELKVGSTYTIQSKGLIINSGAAAWSIENSSGTGALTSIGTMTLTSNAAQNVYAYNNSTSKSQLLMDNTKNLLGYQNPTDDSITTGNSYFKLTPNKGTRLYSNGNLNLYANGKINIIQKDVTNATGFNITSSNSTGTGKIQINLLGLSGSANNSTLIWKDNFINPNSSEYKQELTVYHADINVGSISWIRHVFGLNPGKTTSTAVQKTQGWDIKPGIQTSWEKITEDSKKLYFKQHTVSKSRTDWGETSTCDTSGDNLYDLLLGILDEVAYTLNYSKDVYDSLTDLQNSLGSAAYTDASAYASADHSHDYAASSHTHTGRYVSQEIAGTDMAGQIAVSGIGYGPYTFTVE